MRRLGTVLIGMALALQVPCAIAQEGGAGEAAEIPEGGAPPPEAPKFNSLTDLLNRVKGGWNVEREIGRAHV